MGKQRLSRGERNIRWIETHCRVPEGKHIGEPVRLRPWQKKMVRRIYDSPTRTAIISFARKNGKTAFAACLLLLHLAGPEARQNAQLYSAAQSKDQAAITYGLAAKMIRLSPTLDHFIVIRDHVKELYVPGLGALYKALSAEVKTKLGLSPTFVIHDELGQVQGPRSELYEAIETSFGAQEEPLSIVISTQAPTDADLLSILIDDAKTGADPSIKLFMYTADEDLSPFSLKAIRQANPAYGDFLNPKVVQKIAGDAKRMPSRESSYRNLVLNQRASALPPFIARRLWNWNARPPGDVFATCPVFGALDLSARNDLTCELFVAIDAEKVWHVRPFFFAPAIGLKDRAQRDRVPYDMWARRGHLVLTPGATVDYDYVADHLLAQVDQMPEFRAAAFDRWRMDVLKAAIERRDREITLIDHGQGYKDMAPALDSLEAELLNKRVRHGSHPILNWCVANAIATKDAAGNRKLDKSKATGRIDGAVALAMAIGIGARAMKAEGVSVPSDYQVATA